MKFLDIVILLAVALALAAALRRMFSRTGGGCGSCGGDCSRCGGRRTY